jgi:arylsulfatase A-like enzyme
VGERLKLGRGTLGTGIEVQTQFKRRCKAISAASLYAVLAFVLFQAAEMRGAVTAAPNADGRLNVLFLFADDQRADTIAALGNPIIKTPNLDRLASRGVAFNRAYMQGGFTVQPEAMCYLYDVLPTLGAMCGVAPPPKSEGIDLRGVLQDPARAGRSEMLFAYKGEKEAAHATGMVRCHRSGPRRAHLP